MHSREFALAAKINKDYQKISVSDPALSSAAAAFVQNIDRIVMLAQFAPLMAGMSASAMQLHTDLVGKFISKSGRQAHQDKYGNISIGQSSDASSPFTGMQPISANEYRAYMDVRNRPLSPEEMDAALDRGLLDLNIALSQHPELQIAVQAIFGAQIIGAWTAFEAMAEEVWVAALNARQRLGFQAMQAEPDPEDLDDEAERKRKVKFQIPQWRLKLGFDANTQMGSLLSDKWDFARRDRAEDAYRKAFDDRVDEIRSVFNDQPLKWLAAIRNAIIHDAGKATAEFQILVKKHPVLSAVEDHQQIPIDGGIVAEMISAAVLQAQKLLAFVDQWLKNNPT